MHHITKFLQFFSLVLILWYIIYQILILNYILFTLFFFRFLALSVSFISKVQTVIGCFVFFFPLLVFPCQYIPVLVLLPISVLFFYYGFCIYIKSFTLTCPNFSVPWSCYQWVASWMLFACSYFATCSRWTTCGKYRPSNSKK